MAEFEVLSLRDSENWNALLHQLPIVQQDIYFTPEYYRLYEELGDGKAQCFVFQKGNDIALYPFLINSVNELGYELDKEYHDIQGAYGYNGILTNSYDSQFIEEFYKEFNLFCKENDIIAEFTRFHPLIGNSSFSNNHLEVIFDRKTVFIDLSEGYESINLKFQRTTRKQIRRATEKHGIIVKRFEKDNDIINEFYDVYYKAMKNVSSVDYLFFNKDYFRALLALEKSSCFVAYQNDKIVSAITTIQLGDYLHGHLGGTLNDYQKHSPFSLLYNEIIKYAIKQGCKFVHFGGGTSQKNDDPVFLYKCHFSNSNGEFFIGKKIHNPNVYNEVVSIWKKRYPEKTEKYKNHLLKYRY